MQWIRLSAAGEIEILSESDYPPFSDMVAPARTVAMKYGKFFYVGDPEPTPPVKSIDAQIADIEAEYAEKFSALDASLLNVLWADGPNEVANRQALSVKRQQLVAAKDDAIMNILLMS